MTYTVADVLRHACTILVNKPGGRAPLSEAVVDMFGNHTPMREQIKTSVFRHEVLVCGVDPAFDAHPVRRLRRLWRTAEDLC